MGMYFFRVPPGRGRTESGGIVMAIHLSKPVKCRQGVYAPTEI